MDPTNTLKDDIDIKLFPAALPVMINVYKSPKPIQSGKIHPDTSIQLTIYYTISEEKEIFLY